MAKIYNDFQSANLMSFAKSFARLNGQPLDKSEIWYSLAEAQAYAATDAAYVGQILAVIDSENNKVVFYGIQDAIGTLKEVGSTPIGDDLSIEIVDGAIQLKNFGKKYYAYVPAVKDEETGEILEAFKYVPVEGFKAGLEPRVVLDGEDLVIAWYEPGSETIEDVAANVESVSKVVDELDEALNAEGGLVDQVGDLQEQVGQAADDAGNAATGLFAEIERIDAELDKKANAADVYTKEAANEAIESAIGKAIADSDHLKRIIVDSVADINVEADDALRYIYMVPTGLEADDDKYDEYMVIEYMGADEETGEEVVIRQVERVGSWEVDLSGYAKVSDLNTLSQTVTDNKSAAEQAHKDLQQQITDEAKRATAAEQANAEEIAKKADQANTLAGYGIEDAYTKEETLQKITEKITEVNGGESAGEVLSQLNSYKETNNARVEKIEDELAALEGAEPNFITSVDDANFSVENGKLNLVAVAVNQVAGLQSVLDSKVDAEEGARLVKANESAALEALANGEYNNFITAVNDAIFAVDNGTLNLTAVPVEALSILGDFASLPNAANNYTLIDEINELYKYLTWVDMP